MFPSFQGKKLGKEELDLTQGHCPASPVQMILGTAQPLWSTDIWPVLDAKSKDISKSFTGSDQELQPKCGYYMPLNLKSPLAEKLLIDKSVIDITWGLKGFKVILIVDISLCNRNFRETKR